MTILTTIITSSVIAAIVTGVINMLQSQKKISIENITQERAKWRKTIRKKTLEVHIAMTNKDKKRIDELRTEFATLLNPKDEDDVRLLGTIIFPEEKTDEATGDKNEIQAQISKFSCEVALLLKHDWDRAKLEVSNFFYKIKFINKFFKKHEDSFFAKEERLSPEQVKEILSKDTKAQKK